jgi:hypothetical protein
VKLTLLWLTKDACGATEGEGIIDPGNLPSLKDREAMEVTVDDK